MQPGGSMPHSQELSNKPYPGQINPFPRSDTYFFKIRFDNVLTRPRPP